MSTETTTSDATAATPGTTGNANAESTTNDSKFLTFRLGDEEYGLEILNVREIIGVIDITPLPQTPEWISGVINLRGKIIPVMDLRARFGLESVEHSDETCIIVVEVDHEADGSFQMGVVVDTVSEVLDITGGAIESSPRFGCRLDTSFIMGMGKSKDRVITLLDVHAVLSRETVEAALDGMIPEQDGDDAAAAA